MNAIIEAGTILVGVDGQGRPELRHDAAMRVDKGMIAQIGTIEAVAYGNDHLPRLGSPAMLAAPALLRGGGRLEPGRQADLFGLLASAPAAPREAVRALVDRGETDANLSLFIAGQIWIDRGVIVAPDREAAITALRAYLGTAPNAQEIALELAAARLMPALAQLRS